MNYYEYKFEISPLEPAREILVAELAEAGFESFVDSENGCSAYIQEGDWNDSVLKNVSILSNANFEISSSSSFIKDQNWNKQWESNFSPIQIENKCLVRASFHESNPDCGFEIVINPKMSFGTGHHATTYMMLDKMLDLDFENKTVLDMGCGSGILAILASMKNAKSIQAIDIDEWSYDNAIENNELNNITNVEVLEGNCSKISGAGALNGKSSASSNSGPMPL